MKRKTLIGLAVATALMSSSAYAWDCSYWSQSSNPGGECYKPPVTAGSTSTNTNSNSAAANAASSSIAKASATQGQVQSQNQSQTATGGNSASTSGANNAGNAQSVSFSGNKPVVSTAIAGIGETTAQCRYHDGAGLQLFVVGASFGKSRADKDCQRYSAAQFFYQHGQPEAGNRLMCTVTVVHEALGDDCLTLIKTVLPPAEAYPTGEAERRKEARGFPGNK
jgi:hypothetical protein